VFGVSHVAAQFEGLLAGYLARAEKDSIPDALNPMEVFLLNSVGDLESLNGIEKDSGRLSSSPGENQTSERYLDCSGFVRRTPTGDITVFHSTWRAYYAMLRVAAVWELPFAPARVVSASSSPGFLHSKDDFYVSGGQFSIQPDASQPSESEYAADMATSCRCHDGGNVWR